MWILMQQMWWQMVSDLLGKYLMANATENHIAVTEAKARFIYLQITDTDQWRIDCINFCQRTASMKERKLRTLHIPRPLRCG
jgi:hypothetical protein